MRARSAIAVCLLSALPFTAAPLFAAAKNKPKPKPAPKPLRLDFGVIFDMAGSLVKSVAGSAASSLLFPQKTIDVKKLLADITASVRQELIKNVMDNDDTSLTAATTALNDYETEWKHGADPAATEARVNGDSTINNVNTVIARLGSAGKAEYVDPGLPLFLAAAQIKANRLELRRKLRPDQDASIRPVLISHLEASLAHARATMNRRREEAMTARLGRIADCHVYSKDSHGLPWNLIWTFKTGFYDSGFSTQIQGSSQADDDQTKALARCEGHRQPHVDRIRKKTAAEVDATFASTDAILDAWAKTLDSLKNSQPPITARATRVDFGGMFGIGERSFNNPLTNGQGCPAGYEAYEFKGTYNVDWQAFYCGRIGGVSEPVADFGGMYGKTNDDDWTGTYWIKNSVTNTAGCPAGFTAAEVSNQHQLFYCWKRHEAGKPSPYLFGGLFSDNGDKKNPVTGRLLCPNGYSPALVHGTRGDNSGVPATRQVIMCWVTTPSS